MANNPLDAEDEDEGPDEGWMATFADICMLLLTFFVLLLSMSTIEKTKAVQVFSTIQEVFGGDQLQYVSIVPSISDSERDSSGADLEKTLLEQQIKNFNAMRSAIVQASLDTAINATIDEGIITLRLPDTGLFDYNSADILPEATPTLEFIRDLLTKTRDQTLDIRGFTDDSVLPENSRFKDNWELSSIRALNVLRYFIERGIEPTRMTATGLADLNPVAPNTTEENRARNRRVEFVLKQRITK